MKKTLLTILCVSLLAAGAAGCVAPDDNAVVKVDNPTVVTTTAAPESKETTFKIGEVAKYPDMSITMSSAKFSKGAKLYKPEDGKVFVGADFTIENTSDSEISVSSVLMFDVYVDDVAVDQSISAALAFSSKTLDGPVASGKKLTGTFGIEVPENWNTVEFHVKDSWLSNNKAVFKFTKAEATEDSSGK